MKERAAPVFLLLWCTTLSTVSADLTRVWVGLSWSDSRPVPQEYRMLFDEAGNNPGDKTLEDKFFEREVSSL